MKPTEAMIKAAIKAHVLAVNRGTPQPMKAALEAALAAMWQPITDDEPPQRKLVVIWRGDWGHTNVSYRAGDDFLDPGSGGGGGPCSFQQPTMWAPLPVPPK